MKASKEVSACKNFFNRLGRFEKINIIKNSNLNDRERQAMNLRFVEGATIFQTADIMGMTPDAFVKMQRRVINKMYAWLSRYARVKGTTVENLLNSDSESSGNAKLN